jgi:DNA polymerase II
VLGTPGCRFFDVRLPTAITRRGHAIIERARAFFAEEKKLPVRYGDTDSLFVEIDASLDVGAASALGKALAAELNATLKDEIMQSHRVVSRLELRFDAYYRRFLLPTMRGSERGSKKRYAGLLERIDGSTELVIRGLEAVRTDWTPLARRVQRELFTKVFTEQPVEDWLRRLRAALLAGALDEELVYEKRLRQSASDYTAAPPHVRAAQQLEDEEGTEVDTVRYVITVHGPEPVSLQKSPIDYDHYLTKQLAPACDVILPFLGTDFEKIAGHQMSLF